jgi:tRNA(Ile)-lysidine synthase
VLRAILEAATHHPLFSHTHSGSQTAEARTTGSQTVVVGVSGGADSVCLLHALAQLAPRLGLSLQVAHLDHALRPESAADAEFVARFAATLGLPFHSARLAPGALAGEAGGLEAAARRARYAFLSRIAREVTPAPQAPIIAVAHHQDDQAETVLMNLLRGSGLDGLAGMAWATTLAATSDDVGSHSAGTVDHLLGSSELPGRYRSVDHVRLVRPLLGVRRADIQDYLAAHHLTWREDSSNSDRDRLRNRIRHDVLPMLMDINPNLISTLARTADLLSAEADHAAERDRRALADVRMDDAFVNPPARVVLRLDRLCALDLATQRGVLRRALGLLGVERRDAGYAAIDSLLRRIQREPEQSSGPHPLAGGVAWTLLGADAGQPARLCLHREEALPVLPDHPYLDAGWRARPVPASISCPGVLSIDGAWSLTCRVSSLEELPDDWRQPNQPWRAFLDAERCGPLILTTPRPGLRFAPLGMNGQHKTLGDFFTGRKTPAALRAGWPLICDGATGAIVWVCGLAVSHEAAIRPNTKTILCLEWKHNE